MLAICCDWTGGIDSFTLRRTDRGSAGHLRLLGGFLRIARVADLGVVGDVGWVVLGQLMLWHCVLLLLLLRRVRAVRGGVLVVAGVVAHVGVFCSGGGMGRNVKVYICKDRKGGGGGGRREREGVSDASGVEESESKKKGREGGFSFGLVSDWCGWHGPSSCASWLVK